MWSKRRGHGKPKPCAKPSYQGRETINKQRKLAGRETQGHRWHSLCLEAGATAAARTAVTAVPVPNTRGLTEHPFFSWRKNMPCYRQAQFKDACGGLFYKTGQSQLQMAPVFHAGCGSWGSEHTWGSCGSPWDGEGEGNEQKTWQPLLWAGQGWWRNQIIFCSTLDSPKVGCRAGWRKEWKTNLENLIIYS